MNDIKAAGRVASAIGIIKWIIIVGLFLVGVIYVIGLLDPGFEFNEATQTVEAKNVSGWLVFAVIVGTLFQVLFSWVFFGWLQNVLRMLVRIARNTNPINAVARSNERVEPVPPNLPAGELKSPEKPGFPHGVH